MEGMRVKPFVRFVGQILAFLMTNFNKFSELIF